MIERSHGGREPQPIRRFEREQGIVDNGARPQARIADTVLNARALVGDSGEGCVFASR